ncbi:uncharacterized protein LOC110819592 [Carica papaya]|uniref:uncharacterized protein LOC110819592 n=1 Tax=Carica papaya TaxID=3649 RepID=UPI000B8CFD0B|nr:uncharacterized protein LOC110819592 [Carica papaya]
MATNKTGIISECCMCGDSGLSYELLQCKLCQFRSQHRYCSNLYPKAESYDVCNWCLIIQKEDSKEKSQTSSTSPTSISNTTKNSPRESDQHHDHHGHDHHVTIKNRIIKKIKITNGSNPNGDQNIQPVRLKSQRSAPDQLQQLNGDVVIKKKKPSPERSLATSGTTRRRIITRGRLEEKMNIRRTKSEEISNGGIIKHVYRNKVRRYKLLDEVSS